MKRFLNLILLIAGIALAAILWHFEKPYYALISFLFTFLFFCIRAYLNLKKLRTDPELQKQHELKKLALQRRWGVLDYLNATGVEGSAEVKELLKVRANTETAITDVTMRLEISNLNDPQITVELKREIPNPMVPLFTIGSIFKIKYDKEKPENLIFISIHKDGQETNLKEVYGFN